MRPVTKTLSATGNTDWIPVNWRQVPMEVLTRVDISNGAVLTVKFQYATQLTDLQIVSTSPTALTRVGTTATLVYASDHNLVAGDSLIIQGAGAPFDGVYDVATISNATTLTFTVANSGATTSSPLPRIASLRVQDWPLGGVAADTDDVIAGPVTMVRGVCTAYTSGTAVFHVIQSGG